MPQALRPHQGERPVRGGVTGLSRPALGGDSLQEALAPQSGLVPPVRGSGREAVAAGHCPGGVTTPPPHSDHGCGGSGNPVGSKFFCACSAPTPGHADPQTPPPAAVGRGQRT